jgi:hypothetical protein
LHDSRIRLESRRSAQGSMAGALARMLEQRTALQGQRGTLERSLADGDAPIENCSCACRITWRGGARWRPSWPRAPATRGLATANCALWSSAAHVGAEQLVGAAREAMEQARLAAQESRVRREALLEQFAATQCELQAVLEKMHPKPTFHLGDAAE